MAKVVKGKAINIAPGMVYIKGNNPNKKDDVDIGPNNKDGISLNNGEIAEGVAAINNGKTLIPVNNTLRVFSAEPMLGGVSPVQLLYGGMAPDKVFAMQEQYKRANRIADDGTKYQKGGKKTNPRKGIDWSDIVTTNNRPYNKDYINYINKKLVAAGYNNNKRASILANIIEESGGDPFIEGPGGYYGLLQWGSDRYTKTKEKDVYKEIDNQLKYLSETIGNTNDKKSWTHGGKGSGYNSFTDAMAAYNSDELNKVMHGFTWGYVRPAGKQNSYLNRQKVADQLINLEGFKFGGRKRFQTGGDNILMRVDSEGNLIDSIQPSVVTAKLPAKFNGSQAAAARYAEGYKFGRNVAKNRDKTTETALSYVLPIKSNEDFDANIAGFTPIVGDILQGAQGIKDINSGNYLKGAVELGLLAVPNIIEKPLKQVYKIAKLIKNGGYNKFRHTVPTKLYKELNQFDIDNIRKSTIDYQQFRDLERGAVNVNPYNEAKTIKVRPASRVEIKINDKGKTETNAGLMKVAALNTGNEIIMYPKQITKGNIGHELRHSIMNDLTDFNNNNNYLVRPGHEIVNLFNTVIEQNPTPLGTKILSKNKDNWHKKTDEFDAELEYLRQTYAPNTTYKELLIGKGKPNSLYDKFINYLKPRFNITEDEADIIMKELYDAGFKFGGQTNINPLGERPNAKFGKEMKNKRIKAIRGYDGDKDNILNPSIITASGRKVNLRNRQLVNGPNIGLTIPDIPLQENLEGTTITASGKPISSIDLTGKVSSPITGINVPGLPQYETLAPVTVTASGRSLSSVNLPSQVIVPTIGPRNPFNAPKAISSNPNFANPVVDKYGVTTGVNGNVTSIKTPESQGLKVPEVTPKTSKSSGLSALGADLIGAGINAAGSLIAAGINQKAINDQKFTPRQYNLLNHVKLKTKINIDPQLSQMRESVAKVSDAARRTSASSRNAYQKIANARLTGLNSMMGLYGDKENKETQLINQDRLNQQQIAAQNSNRVMETVNYNITGKDALANRKAMLTAQNWINPVNVIARTVAGPQGLLARRDVRRNTAANLAMMSLAHPDAARMIMSGDGWQKAFNGYYDMLNNKVRV